MGQTPWQKDLQITENCEIWRKEVADLKYETITLELDLMISLYLSIRLLFCNFRLLQKM